MKETVHQFVAQIFLLSLYLRQNSWHVVLQGTLYNRWWISKLQNVTRIFDDRKLYKMADISCLLSVRLENHLFFCFSTCCTQSAAVFGGKPADFNQVAWNSVTILGGTSLPSLLYLCLTMCWIDGNGTSGWEWPWISGKDGGNQSPCVHNGLSTREESESCISYRWGVFVSIYSWQISTQPAESSNHRANAEKGSQFLDEAAFVRIRLLYTRKVMSNPNLREILSSYCLS